MSVMNHLLYLLAQGPKIDAGSVGIPTGDEQTIFDNVVNLIFYLGGFAAVVSIIVGGLMYVTAGGDAGKITKAKNLVLFSAVGLAVILSAFFVVQFLLGRFS